MQLAELSNINKTILTALNAAGWTVESIATTTPQRLASIPGVGVVTATRLIDEAKVLVNQTLLDESEIILPPPPQQMYAGGMPPELFYESGDMARRSVRIQRIFERGAV